MEYQNEEYDPIVKSPVVKAVTLPNTADNTIISGLMPFTYYKIRLVATNTADIEGRSDWVTIRTAMAAPSGVSDIQAVKMEDGQSLLLSWNAPSFPNGEVPTIFFQLITEINNPIHLTGYTLGFKI